MNVSGEEAKLYDAVRLDNFERANRGELISADDVSGIVIYKDAAGEAKTVTLGEHAIRILPKGRYG
ncbi:MAG: hypothetical protein EPO09_21750 [Aquabacterium sp.]|uniref:hypothetical protein n=1 Tax=Aquabacterium sp. TaxID=1872578 RepID=UPI001201510A|nr:hypothetical protein [Aquabacterium sp.]TAK81878.1 MAG: hypothetical protein EPO09_21750 [Aquabacterium sp.]